MKIINSIIELRNAVGQCEEVESVGFVPTMGALHKGHISLVKRCRKENNVVVVSLFVNPTQFNDNNDLIAYPRTEDQDIALLQGAGCDILFMPSVEDMYPEPDTRKFDFGLLEQVMEGVKRPGHFNGVAQIVSKLFDAVLPGKAYFGEKDYQQLAIIRKMTLDLEYKIEIIGCNTCRAEDGLALSSRNMLLTPCQRKSAPMIYKIIKEASQKDWQSALDAENFVIAQVNSVPEFEVEYFTIADENTLQFIDKWEECDSKRGFIVVRVGAIRLIDNIKFNRIFNN